MTVKDLLVESYTILGKELALDAEILLAHATGKDRSWMLAHPEVAVGTTEVATFRSMVTRRQSGEPVAYIIGSKEFFGIDFFVDARVLIPRPETEMLTELALEELDRGPSAVVIDVGTGSGAIAIAIAKHAPRSRIIATDSSRDALRVAEKNARHQNVISQIEFMYGHLLTPIDHWSGRYVIVANLPYLSDAEYEAEPSIHAEPKAALIAGEEGNAVYREFFMQLKKLPEGVLWSVFCEFDPRHAEWMSRAAAAYFPRHHIKIQKDLAGHERVLSIRPV